MKFSKLTTVCLTTLLLSSCLKQQFDSPPDTSHYDPALPVNCSIANINENTLNLASNKGRVMGDSTITGIVIGDDRSGNIYKQIVIEDTAGSGIAVVIDRTNLYGDFPVGRKVYVKLKGLYIVNYRGLPEIVYAVDSVTGTTTGIPATLVGNFVVAASYPHTVAAKSLTISDLFSSPARYLNTLIKLDNMQFDAASANVMYSNPNASTNRTIKDCPFTGALTMYNSSYSTFQAATTPGGKGSITGIFTTYYTTPQFVLRDTTDVVFTTSRVCP